MAISTQNTQRPLRTYETICVTKVDMPEEKFNAMVEKCKTVIATEGRGQLLMMDDWGRAKISYPIQKETRGRWTYLRYKASSEGINELNRNLSINESVLRFHTVKTDETGKDYETLRANIVTEMNERERVRDWKEERSFRKGPRRYNDGGDRDAPMGDDMMGAESGAPGEE
jgi:small subunit ribosomal protein S6